MGGKTARSHKNENQYFMVGERERNVQSVAAHRQMIKTTS